MKKALAENIFPKLLHLQTCLKKYIGTQKIGIFYVSMTDKCHFREFMEMQKLVNKYLFINFW